MPTRTPSMLNPELRESLIGIFLRDFKALLGIKEILCETFERVIDENVKNSNTIKQFKCESVSWEIYRLRFENDRLNFSANHDSE